LVGVVAPQFPRGGAQEDVDLYPLVTLRGPKLGPRTGYVRRPWVERQNAVMDSEGQFSDAGERLRAMAAYYGLCSWLDHSVGRILNSLDEAGYGRTTAVVYTSDHGDNVGARGLWGKSNFYQESVAVPLIVAGPDVPAGICDTPVSLLDLSATIPAHYVVEFGCIGRPLTGIAAGPADPERQVFSEYHAAGAVSGAFMLRKGRWKYIHYIGFPPELFDLDSDPQELEDLASEPAHARVVDMMHAGLTRICDPVAVDEMAFTDQAAMVERYGGREEALKLGMRGATPPPETRT